MQNKERGLIVSEFVKDGYIVGQNNLDSIFNNEILVLINPFIYPGEGKIPENKYHKKVFDVLLSDKKPLIVIGDIGIHEALIKTILSYPKTPRIFYSIELYEKTNKLESILRNILEKITPKKILLADSMSKFTQSELEKNNDWDIEFLSYSEELFLSLRKKYNVKLSPLLKNLETKYNGGG